MYTLTEKQFQIEAYPIFRRIFTGNNAFECPFASSITARRIIYPCETDLERPFLEALIEGASSIGDSGCYLSQLWVLDDENYNHCYIPLSELLEGYTALPESGKDIHNRLHMNMSSEYALYSSAGNWGLIACHEYHGVLGSSPKFMEVVKKKLPNLDRQALIWLNYLQQEKVRGKAPRLLEWLPKLLTHVYGQEEAQKLLKKIGLS